MIKVLFNPKSASYKGEGNARKLVEKYPNEEFSFEDITQLNVKEYLEKVDAEDKIVIAGGDGTLNRFINDIDGKAPDREILFYGAGTGNDFLNDVLGVDGDKTELVSLNKYINNLPKVYVNGMERYFINGIGYGIDGYCCEEGDKLRESGAEKINYASIAIKGVLGKYKTTEATVVADGKTYTFHRALLVPTMKGRFYGGGMMPTPDQDRFDPEKKVSFMVYKKNNTLGTLMLFPKIFKGEHVKNKKYVFVKSCKEITVTFDSPRALQIDGETVTNVLTYTVKTEY